MRPVIASDESVQWGEKERRRSLLSLLTVLMPLRRYNADLRFEQRAKTSTDFDLLP